LQDSTTGPVVCSVLVTAVYCYLHLLLVAGFLPLLQLVLSPSGLSLHSHYCWIFQVGFSAHNSCSSSKLLLLFSNKIPWKCFNCCYVIVTLTAECLPDVLLRVLNAIVAWVNCLLMTILHLHYLWLFCTVVWHKLVKNTSWTQFSIHLLNKAPVVIRRIMLCMFV